MTNSTSTTETVDPSDLLSELSLEKDSVKADNAADTTTAKVAKATDGERTYDEEAIAKELSNRLASLSNLSTIVPAGFSVIPGKLEHIPEKVKISNVRNVHFDDEWASTEEDFERNFRTPDREMSDKLTVIEDSTKRVVGSASVFLKESTGVAYVNTFGDILHPKCLEIEEALMRIGELLVEGKQDRVAEDKPIVIKSGANALEKGKIEILEKKLGYSNTRAWYDMRIELVERPSSEAEEIPVQIPAPQFPAGLELRPYIREKHAHQLHKAQQEAFRDHSGHAEDTAFETWDFWTHDPKTYNPDYFFILWDGDEIAAGVYGGDVSENSPGQAFVFIVFSRRAWRRQGLAGNLLRQAFRTFQAAGLRSVELGVDGKSKTNAVALYERAGMRRRREYPSYMKLIRGNIEDVID